MKKIELLFVAHKPVIIPSKELSFFNSSTYYMDHQKYADVCVIDHLLNLESEIKGFFQYRRFLVKYNNPLFIFLNIFPFHNILDTKKIKRYLSSGYDAIVPKSEYLHGKNLFEQYGYPGISSDFELAKNIIAKICPEYLHSFEKVVYQKNYKPHFHNIIIAREELFNHYSKWLLNILKNLESEIDYKSRDELETRALGYLAERLLNVYIVKHNLKVIGVKMRVLDRDQNYVVSGVRYFIIALRNKIKLLSRIQRMV